MPTSERRPCTSDPRSCAHWTQRLVCGKASIRSLGIGLPQISQTTFSTTASPPQTSRDFFEPGSRASQIPQHAAARANVGHHCFPCFTTETGVQPARSFPKTHSRDGPHGVFGISVELQCVDAQFLFWPSDKVCYRRPLARAHASGSPSGIAGSECAQARLRQRQRGFPTQKPPTWPGIFRRGTVLLQARQHLLQFDKALAHELQLVQGVLSSLVCQPFRDVLVFPDASRYQFFQERVPPHE